MPNIEVDESVFLNNKKVADLVATMLKNPDARKRVLEAQKIVQPDAVIPEIDATKPITEALDTMRKEMSETLKSITDRDAEREKKARETALQNEWNAGRAKLTEAGYNEEGIKKIEELMGQKGIINHEDGKILFEAANPPSPVTPSSYGPGYNFYDLNAESPDDMKKLLESKGEDQAVMNKLINSALSEVRGR